MLDSLYEKGEAFVRRRWWEAADFTDDRRVWREVAKTHWTWSPLFWLVLIQEQITLDLFLLNRLLLQSKKGLMWLSHDLSKSSRDVYTADHSWSQWCLSSRIILLLSEITFFLNSIFIDVYTYLNSNGFGLAGFINSGCFFLLRLKMKLVKNDLTKVSLCRKFYHYWQMPLLIAKNQLNKEG